MREFSRSDEGLSGTKGRPESDFGAALLQGVPLRKELARPEEIAPSVIFLISGDSAWVTGERINASGGVCLSGEPIDADLKDEER
jgi:NAD(P)-dependent dehydrogenase (short-subunit alcohol dehydrogenase family)